MNILIPDSWLREFLQTKANPAQIGEYLSLCGPSVERIDKQGGETIYTIEVTSNRPDSMSVAGIAREAAAILPRFGIKTTLIGDPYTMRQGQALSRGSKRLQIKTDPKLNPRFTAVVIDNVKVGPSPAWMQKRLTATGIRPLNNVVDITNWLMRAYGQPAHAFDYDMIKGAAMRLRASRKGEKLTTLDGKTHTLPGDDIVIEDGTGRLIDLCGIMGAANSAIRETTKTVVLFMQTYDPAHIRKTSMRLAHRTEAAALFEKGIDSELVMPTILKGIDLMKDLTGGTVASKIFDLYPNPYKTYAVSVSLKKITSYMGRKLTTKELTSMLTPLGFATGVKGDAVTVRVPSYRRDVAIDVDVIEEIARIWGYHNITPTLPDTAPPISIPDPILAWEKEVKTHLRDWGYTELITYSMISEEQMDKFGLNKKQTYKIANPLSVEWVYMRPTLWPSILEAMKQNLNLREQLQVFEIANVYLYRKGELPQETPVLIVAWTGHKIFQAKGVAEAIFSLFGVQLPPPPGGSSKLHDWDSHLRLILGDYGSVSEVNAELLAQLGISQPVTIFWVHLDKLIANAKPTKIYTPIPSHPPIIEDFTFVVPAQTPIAPLLRVLRGTHKLIANVTLKDVYENTRTIRVWFADPKRNLTNEDVAPARKALIAAAQKRGITLKE
jgi:phenylalanyl-tRNA synthetase beta chain